MAKPVPVARPVAPAPTPSPAPMPKITMRTPAAAPAPASVVASVKSTDDITKKLEMEKSRYEELQGLYQANLRLIAQRDASIEQLQASVKAREKELAEVKAIRADRAVERVALTARNEEVKRLHKQIEQVQASLDSKRDAAHLDDLHQRISELESQLFASEEGMEKASEAAEKAEQKAYKSLALSTELSRKLKDRDEALAELKKEKSELESDAKRAEKEINHYKAEVEKLKTDAQGIQAILEEQTKTLNGIRTLLK